MKLNALRSGEGSRTKRARVGRGIGSGLGKTCGRGHKGQKSRSGGFHKVGFEGGQMPIQRRLPKIGFRSSANADLVELRLYQLNTLQGDEVNLEVLKAAGLIKKDIKRVKIVNTGEVERSFKITGLSLTKGAAEAITKAGGSIE
ncbi:MAG: 50S ribosomal protein L15 [Xanthomonadales bacterium]|nr:50S ribosomal protein L15 [Xanthomonadales bacterium]